MASVVHGSPCLQEQAITFYLDYPEVGNAGDFFPAAKDRQFIKDLFRDFSDVKELPGYGD